eukprot:gene14719-31291_t
MIDLIISSLIGLILAGGIIIFLSRNPGKPFDYSTGEYIDLYSTQNSEKSEGNENNENDVGLDLSESIQRISEEDLLKKTASLQKFLGLSEDDIRHAVRKTNKELDTGIIEQDNVSWSKIFDWILFIVALCIIGYFANKQTNGDIGRVLAGLFPREFETLGIKKQMEEVSRTTDL